MNFSIRPYKKEDKEHLITVFKQNVPKSFAEVEVKDFDGFLNTRKSDYFVMELNGQIIGASGIDYDVKTNSGSIIWIFLSPQQTGKGFGKALVKYCTTELNSKYTPESCCVRTSQMASDFFKAIGFKLQSIEKDYWAPGYDLYVMELSK